MNAPEKFGLVYLRAEPQRTPIWLAGLGLGWRTGDRCQRCGHIQWLVGRTTVECAVCGNVQVPEAGVR